MNSALILVLAVIGVGVLVIVAAIINVLVDYFRFWLDERFGKGK